jgi:hypothetical protein
MQMANLQGGLYSSNTQVRRVMKVFLQVHQCKVCDRFFTEMENLGSWRCTYHPGKWDYVKRHWTCCKEKERQNVGDNSYLCRYYAMNPKERLNMPGPHSDGCMACDCVSRYKNPVPQKEVALEDIACIIPQLGVHGKPLEKRNGLERGRKPRIVRYEECPECFM